jgi:DNA-binding XRE family transcriptional regulator
MSTKSLIERDYQVIGKMRSMSKVGENVRRFRLERGFSQAKLAKMIGARSQNTIVAIEAGGETKHVPALARALKVSIHDLDPALPPQDSFIIDAPGLIAASLPAEAYNPHGLR